MNETFGTAFIVGFGWLLSLCFHEFSHAAVAYMGGDKSVKDKGYLTFNPLRYTDVNLTLILPLIILMLGGIALPGAAVYINHNALRNRFWASLVSLAGPLSNVVCLLIISAIFRYSPDVSADHWLWPSLALLALYQTIAILLNSLPIPPLDGFGVIEPWLPKSAQQAANRFGQIGILVLFASLWFVTPLNQALWITAYSIGESLSIPIEIARLASERFRAGAMILLVFILVVSFFSRRKSSNAN